LFNYGSGAHPNWGIHRLRRFSQIREKAQAKGGKAGECEAEESSRVPLTDILLTNG
jgi:hypothetical protein